MSMIILAVGGGGELDAGAGLATAGTWELSEMVAAVAGLAGVANEPFESETERVGGGSRVGSRCA